MDSAKRLQEDIKRFLDLTLAIVLLALFGPPLLLVALAVRLESEGPALYRQKRAGKDGRVFTLYKLRSMRISNDQRAVFHGEENVTRVGSFIRRWRIDEMPQFINVLRGEMSIVGPRPTLPYQAARYDREQSRRLSVRPGLTGWSQVHGESAISWPDRIALDLWYIDNWSLWLDLKIMLLTPVALLRIRKINAEQGPPPDEISRLPTDRDPGEE